MSRRERQRRRRRNRGSPIKRGLAMVAILGICGLAMAGMAVAGYVIKIADAAPNLSSLKPELAGRPSPVYAADGTLLGYIWSPSVRTPVAGRTIPTILKQATVAIEDRRFYQHGALDYQGIIRAAIRDAFSGGGLQGASTLTMQLIDNTYLPHKYVGNHDLTYKIVQAKLAEQLEAKHSKAWILDNYLNDVPYGTVYSQEAYGVGAAARLFFDKPVWKLDLAQAALLAGLPQAPGTYDPLANPQAALERRTEVLQAMVTAGYISQATATSTEQDPLELHPNPTSVQHKQPYVFDFIEQQLAKDLCPKTPTLAKCPELQAGGLKVYTTIDLHKQAQAQQAIANHKALLGEQGYGQAAAGLASIDAGTGHILAIASSASYNQTRFDYATQAHRQPGSSFKTFALMTLIHDYDGDPNKTYYTSKFLPAGWLPAAPTWSVHTAEESYQGDISITKATTVSDNTVFVQLAADLGYPKLDAMAHAMGITSPLDGNPAEVIGGLRVGVTPLEMADAYATLANGGVHIPPTIISKVVFSDGSSRNFGNPPHTRVFPYNQAYEGTQVLKTVIQDGTGTNANYGCPAAGKTGTANNLENAWFVGYNPRISTAVWVGYPQGNLPMSDGFGGDLAAPIWHDYMEAASGGYCGDWTPPSTPFVGTQFFGHFAMSGPGTTSSTTSSTTTKTTSGNGGTPIGTRTSTSSSSTSTTTSSSTTSSSTSTHSSTSSGTSSSGTPPKKA
jgi:penicillin-binding protein 1A